MIHIFFVLWVFQLLALAQSLSLTHPTVISRSNLFSIGASGPNIVTDGVFHAISNIATQRIVKFQTGIMSSWMIAGEVNAKLGSASSPVWMPNVNVIELGVGTSNGALSQVCKLSRGFYIISFAWMAKNNGAGIDLRWNGIKALRFISDSRLAKWEVIQVEAKEGMNELAFEGFRPSLDQEAPCITLISVREANLIHEQIPDFDEKLVNGQLNNITLQSNGFVNEKVPGWNQDQLPLKYGVNHNPNWPSVNVVTLNEGGITSMSQTVTLLPLPYTLLFDSAASTTANPCVTLAYMNGQLAYFYQNSDKSNRIESAQILVSAVDGPNTIKIEAYSAAANTLGVTNVRLYQMLALTMTSKRLPSHIVNGDIVEPVMDETSKIFQMIPGGWTTLTSGFRIIRGQIHNSQWRVPQVLVLGSGGEQTEGADVYQQFIIDEDFYVLEFLFAPSEAKPEACAFRMDWNNKPAFSYFFSDKSVKQFAIRVFAHKGRNRVRFVQISGQDAFSTGIKFVYLHKFQDESNFIKDPQNLVLNGYFQQPLLTMMRPNFKGPIPGWEQEGVELFIGKILNWRWNNRQVISLASDKPSKLSYTLPPIQQAKLLLRFCFAPYEDSFEASSMRVVWNDFEIAAHYPCNHEISCDQFTVIPSAIQSNRLMFLGTGFSAQRGMTIRGVSIRRIYPVEFLPVDQTDLIINGLFSVPSLTKGDVGLVTLNCQGWVSPDIVFTLARVVVTNPKWMLEGQGLLAGVYYNDFYCQNILTAPGSYVLTYTYAPQKRSVYESELEIYWNHNPAPISIIQPCNDEARLDQIYIMVEPERKESQICLYAKAVTSSLTGIVIRDIALRKALNSPSPPSRKGSEVPTAAQREKKLKEALKLQPVKAPIVAQTLPSRSPFEDSTSWYNASPIHQSQGIQGSYGLNLLKNGDFQLPQLPTTVSFQANAVLPGWQPSPNPKDNPITLIHIGRFAKVPLFSKNSQAVLFDAKTPVTLERIISIDKNRLILRFELGATDACNNCAISIEWNKVQVFKTQGAQDFEGGAGMLRTKYFNIFSRAGPNLLTFKVTGTGNDKSGVVIDQVQLHRGTVIPAYVVQAYNFVDDGTFESVKIKEGAFYQVYTRSINSWISPTMVVLINSRYGSSSWNDDQSITLDAGSGGNTKVFQAVFLPRNSFYLLSFESTGVSNQLASCGLAVSWNNVLLGAFGYLSNVVQSFQMLVYGMKGSNSILFEGRGTPDGYGAFVNNVFVQQIKVLDSIYPKVYNNFIKSPMCGGPSTLDGWQMDNPSSLYSQGETFEQLFPGAYIQLSNDGGNIAAWQTVTIPPKKLYYLEYSYMSRAGKMQTSGAHVFWNGQLIGAHNPYLDSVFKKMFIVESASLGTNELRFVGSRLSDNIGIIISCIGLFPFSYKSEVYEQVSFVKFGDFQGLSVQRRDKNLIFQRVSFSGWQIGQMEIRYGFGLNPRWHTDAQVVMLSRQSPWLSYLFYTYSSTPLLFSFSCAAAISFSYQSSIRIFHNEKLIFTQYSWHAQIITITLELLSANDRNKLNFTQAGRGFPNYGMQLKNVQLCRFSPKSSLSLSVFNVIRNGEFTDFFDPAQVIKRYLKQWGSGRRSLFHVNSGQMGNFRWGSKFTLSVGPANDYRVTQVFQVIESAFMLFVCWSNWAGWIGSGFIEVGLNANRVLLLFAGDDQIRCYNKIVTTRKGVNFITFKKDGESDGRGGLIGSVQLRRIVEKPGKETSITDTTSVNMIQLGQ